MTLSGPVAQPGVYEIEYGASLSSLIDAAGGTSGRTRAALIGGYAGAWIGGELLRGVALSEEHLAPHGASLGAGVIALLSEDACPVAETARVARWLADESAGQCGPCLNGLDALATTVAELAAGRRRATRSSAIERLASLVHGRGACGHPDGAVRCILSAAARRSPRTSPITPAMGPAGTVRRARRAAAPRGTGGNRGARALVRRLR